MNVETARALVRQSLRVGTASYTDTEIDRALQYIGNDFVEHVRNLPVKGTVALGTVNPNNTIPTNGLTRFYPQNLFRVQVIDYQGLSFNVEHVDWETVQRAITATGTSPVTAIPTRIAFVEGTTGIIDYTPGTTAQRLDFYYFDTFPTWTAGGTGTAVTQLDLGIPDRHAFPVFYDGAAAVVSFKDNDNRVKSEGWAKYLQHRQFVQGISSGDTGVIYANERNLL